MCRLLFYQGRSLLALDQLLERPPHSLMHQALAPKELNPNLPSADGWGTVWYPDDSKELGAYRSILPMWRDGNLRTLAPHVASRQFLAATRVATADAELTITSVMPFVHEALSFAHNGELQDFEKAFLLPIREGLSAQAQRVTRSVTDSSHLFACFVDLVQAGASLSQAADALVGFVRSLCERVNRGATLCLVAASRQEAVAVRYATPAETHPSLYSRKLRHGIVVASEPLDDEPGWQAVAPNRRLTFVEGELSEERAL